MKKVFKRMVSLLLTIIMVINLLPLGIFAEEVKSASQIGQTSSKPAEEPTRIVEEVPSKRTEFTKEFKLNNGLHMVAVYPEAVHFETEDGQWEDIDNTLTLTGFGNNAVYTNTAGVWEVSFPQSMNSTKQVSISKDGYTLAFGMAGQLRRDPNAEIMSVETEAFPPDATEVVEEVLETIPAEVSGTPTEGAETVPVENAPVDTAEIMEMMPAEGAEDPAEGFNEHSEVPEQVAEAIPDETAAEEIAEGTDTMPTEAAPEQTEDDETLPVEITEEEPVVDFTAPSLVPEDEVSSDNDSLGAENGEDETLAVNPAATSIAQLQPIDLTAVVKDMEYPEIVSQKLNSRLSYNNLFSGTNVVFDLSSNKVKESIVMESYDEDLRGFRYSLDVGDMIPVLGEDGHIDLYDADREKIVMVMPAPYMVDNSGEMSFDVSVILVPNGEAYTLNYLIPLDWVADLERSWPVILDPVVEADIDINNIRDATVSSAGDNNRHYTEMIVETGVSQTDGISRFFVSYNSLPALTSADIIVSAEISIMKYQTTSSPDVVEVHKVLEEWRSETIVWSNQPDYDPVVEDYVFSSTGKWYKWNITDIVRDWYSNKNTGMMFKSTDAVEASGSPNFEEFYSSDTTAPYRPTLLITFRNNNGLESYWDYTASSAGRAGTGYVNNYTGNLVWVRNDIGFGGNRMPVSISHIYNANDSTKNDFGLGYGWRTNFNQLVYVWSENNNYYVWEDGDGTKHYFQFDSANTYKDEDGLELTLKTNGSGTSKYSITDKYGNVSFFDTQGRLTKMSNNQTTQSHITINYLEANNPRISTITDGAGRVYSFTYPSSSGLLSEISYTGTDTKEDAYVNFGYTSSKLTQITDKDSKYSTFAYTTNNLLSSATDVDGYKLSYTYTQTTAGKPSRVKTVKETSGSATGGELTIEYAHNQTTFTDHNGNVQIVQFNNWGNTVSIQDGEGRAQYAKYANNAASSTETGKGNQLKLASKLQNTVGNMLDNSSFESDTAWTVTSGTVTRTVSSDAAYMGAKSLKLTRASAGTAAGAYAAFSAEANQTYTFSAYVKTEAGSAYLSMADGTTSVSSQVLPVGSDWTRLEVSYTATTAKTVGIRLMTADAGSVYMDCVQLEKAPTASRYNLIQNGDFRLTTFWSPSSGCTELAETQKVPATQLDRKVYRINGNPSAQNRISQTVQVSGSKGDTFIVAGWAKADAVPIVDLNNENRPRNFGIQVVFNYTDGTTSASTGNIAYFNPDTDSSVNWQYTAAPAVADKAYSSVTVRVLYDYNANTAYFDGIQLYKEEFGETYTYDDNGNVISVLDLQKKKTTYEYTSNNLTKTVLPSGAVLTYTYDGYHNVKTAKTDQGVLYNFAYDTYGNNTSVSITNGGQTLRSTAEYENNGNTLKKTTDAAGKVTTYHYDAETNVLDWVQYPEDTEATRTVYTYDDMYRLGTAAATTDQGSALTASYTYENDLLKKIETASTTYTFAYGNFALRSSIKVGSRELANYTYTSRNNYLDTLEYGNDDSVKYTYDDLGRIKTQTYEDGDTVSYGYDNNGALATVKDSGSGMTTTYYYDFLQRPVKYTEVSSGQTNTVEYTYDVSGNLKSAASIINGGRRTVAYAYDKDNRVSLVANAAARENYTYDSFGRTATHVTSHNGTTILTDTFTYRTPTSSTTSGQIATLNTVSPAGYNKTYTYTYDDNGNILTINDGSVTFSYEYDTANQLIRENHPYANKTWVWKYDNAGNILSKTQYAFTTGANLGEPTDVITYEYNDSDWGDLLTKFDGREITYDEIGNPLNDGEWTYTWEHGRQLKSMSNGSTTWTFTYNSDGLRTGRTNGTTTYTYIYKGDKLSRMVKNNITLNFIHDKNGSPMVLVYNGVNYYYVTNIQGDVMSIVDGSGNVVVTYFYDAFGQTRAIQGSMASTIGVVNPYRYRGYVWDTEIGMFYLQSRYYDPEIGRFINADGLLAAGTSCLANNLFTYCVNNPVNYVDLYGYDAIWIHEGQSAEGCGHSGLLVYNEASGTWFYFYWGPVDENANVLVLSSVGVPCNLVWVEIKVDDNIDLSTAEGVRQAMKSSDEEFVQNRTDYVTDVFYFHGDYSATFDYINKLSDREKNWYHLLINNCVQNTWMALSMSNPLFLLQKCPVVPDMAYAKMLSMNLCFTKSFKFVTKELNETWNAVIN